MLVLALDMLRFCSEAKTALRKAKRNTLSLTWRTSDRQFGQQIEKFRMHQRNVEKEVHTSHMIGKHTLYLNYHALGSSTIDIIVTGSQNAKGRRPKAFVAFPSKFLSK